MDASDSSTLQSTSGGDMSSQSNTAPAVPPPPSVGSSSVGRASNTRTKMSGAASSAGGTTLRSRVTVVCAECKKQKLKCDRQTPCESCKKRNTVDRCHYSQMALDKVDIINVHNRLKTIEDNVSQMSHSSTTKPEHVPGPSTSMPPPQMHGYPYAPPYYYPPFPDYRAMAPPSFSPSREASTPRRPVMRVLAKNESGATVAPPMEGNVNSLWIREVAAETGHDVTLRAASAMQDGSPKPHRQFGFGVVPIDRGAIEDDSCYGFGKFSKMNVNERMRIHAGLGPSIGGTDAESSTSGQESARPAPADMYEPFIENLIKTFPPVGQRHEMLRRWGFNVNTVSRPCVPFNALRARVDEVCSVIDEDSSSRTGPKKPMPHFSVVAEVAAALALGALLWTKDPGGAYSTITPNPPEPSARPPDSMTAFSLHSTAQLALSCHLNRHGFAAFDSSYMHAKILSAQYSLLAHSTSRMSTSSSVGPELPGLVYSIIGDARVMGLNVDPDEFDPVQPTPSHPNEASNEQGSESTDPEVTPDPTVKQEESDNGGARRKRTAMSVFEKEVRRRLWMSVIWLDLMVSDSTGFDPVIKSWEYTTRLPNDCDDTMFYPDSPTIPLPDETRVEKNNTFYILKLRVEAMTQIARKACDENSGDETFAQRMTNELHTLLSSVPERFRMSEELEDMLTSRSSSPPPMAPLLPPGTQPTMRHLPPEDAVLVVQRCDLMLSMYYTLMRVLLPRITLASSSQIEQGRIYDIAGRTDLADTPFACLNAIRPALWVIQVAEMQMQFAPLTPAGTFHLFLFVRRVFDAAVVLAFVAIQQPLFINDIVLDAVRTARDMLHRMLPGPVINMKGIPIKNEVVFSIETMLKRAEAARRGGSIGPGRSGKKRKHGDMDVTSKIYQHHFRFPFLGAGIMMSFDDIVDAAAIHERTDPLPFRSASRNEPIGLRMHSAPSTHQGMGASDLDLLSPRLASRRNSTGAQISLGRGQSSRGSPSQSRQGSMQPSPTIPHPAPNLHSQFAQTNYSVSPVPRQDSTPRMGEPMNVTSPQRGRHPMNFTMPGRRLVSDTSFGMPSSPVYDTQGMHGPPSSATMSSATSSATPGSSYEYPSGTFPHVNSFGTTLGPHPQGLHGPISLNDPLSPGGDSGLVNAAAGPSNYPPNMGLMHPMPPYLPLPPMGPHGPPHPQHSASAQMQNPLDSWPGSSQAHPYPPPDWSQAGSPYPP